MSEYATEITLNGGSTPAYDDILEGVIDEQDAQLLLLLNVAEDPAFDADYAFNYDWGQTWDDSTGYIDIDLTVNWDTDPGTGNDITAKVEIFRIDQVSLSDKYGDVDNVLDKTGVEYTDLGFDNSDQLSGFVSKLIGEAAMIVEDYCQRDFEQHDRTTERDGSGLQTMTLKGYPVISINSVKVDNEIIDSSTYRVKDNSVFTDENAGILERKYKVWPTGWENITIDYSYGYATPPGTIVNVVEDLASEMLLRYEKNQKVGGASNMSMDGYSADFEFDDLLDEDKKQRLDPYARIVGV